MKNNEFEASFYHFENANILRQKHIIRNIIATIEYFFYSIKSKNNKEIMGN
ncbi:DUF3703 domain-containing protein [Polaribacter sp. IC066]|nr:DUF3703 domain-containing protein [Polaribacter sp. IC063]TXD59662.1 DUF3703 domain-containing protein [Polaribacter sp. IC066]